MLGRRGGRGGAASARPAAFQDSAREVGISAPDGERPLFPEAPPPTLLELDNDDEYMVNKQRSLMLRMQQSPFYVADSEAPDIERYTDKYRSDLGRHALLASWIPAHDPAAFFPEELLAAVRKERAVSQRELDLIKSGRVTSQRAATAMARTLAVLQQREEQLSKRGEAEAEEGEGEGEAEEAVEEEEEDFNDYAIDYYDESGESEGEEGATF